MFKKKVITMGLLISICLGATACGNKANVETTVGNSISNSVNTVVDAGETILDDINGVDKELDNKGVSDFIEEAVDDVTGMVDELVDGVAAIDKGVSDAIMSHYDGIFLKADASGEGHVVLGREKDSETGNVLVYALTTYAEYDMQEEALVRIDGSEIVPTLITLSETEGSYELVSFEMLDERDINELVPEEYREAMLNVENYSQVLFDMELESAKNNPNEDNATIEIITPSAVVDKTLTTVFDSVREGLGMDYFPNMEITPDILEMVYGVTPDMYDAVYGEMPMVSANVDVLIGVKASEGMLNQVQDTLNNYVKTLKADTMQYPSNLAKIPATTIVSRGDYVFVVATFGDTTVVEPDGDDAILKVAQENVNKTIEIIKSVIPE